jgi:hypothetical protein
MLYRIGFLGLVTGLLAGCLDEGRIWKPDSTGTGGGGGSGGGATSGAGGDEGTSAPVDDASSPICDALDECGTYDSGCSGCAVRGQCLEVYQNCDESCATYNKCLDSCGGNVACKQSCKDDNPSGAERYTALITCLVCQACPTSCSVFKSTVCAP